MDEFNHSYLVSLILRLCVDLDFQLHVNFVRFWTLMYYASGVECDPIFSQRRSRMCIYIFHVYVILQCVLKSIMLKCKAICCQNVEVGPWWIFVEYCAPHYCYRRCAVIWYGLDCSYAFSSLTSSFLSPIVLKCKPLFCSSTVDLIKKRKPWICFLLYNSKKAW